jgi:hypothetical protein
VKHVRSHATHQRDHRAQLSPELADPSQLPAGIVVGVVQDTHGSCPGGLTRREGDHVLLRRCKGNLVSRRCHSVGQVDEVAFGAADLAGVREVKDPHVTYTLADIKCILSDSGVKSPGADPFGAM